MIVPFLNYQNPLADSQAWQKRQSNLYLLFAPMKKFLFRPRTIPVAFLLLCLAAYGLLVPWLGFFWDDWPYTWFGRTLGPAGLIKALVNDRVFLAGVYAVTTTLLGQSPLTWQIFAILTRWLSVLALWWTLRQAWPKYPRPVTWVALLFAVYPGFLQNWVSVIYSQVYLLLAATIVSIGLMLYAIRRASGIRYWLLTALAIVLSLISLFSTEYFFGMELLRPILIWFVLAEREPAWRKRIRPALLYWLPYLAELIFFVIWRTFIFKSEQYQVQALGELTSSVQSTIVSFLRSLVTDSFTGGLAAWGQIFRSSPLFDLSTTTSRLTWLVILASLGVLVFYLWKLRYRDNPAEGADEDSSSHWAVQAIITGIAALFAAIIPFWAANLPFDLSFPYNRFTLAMMLGSCLLVVGLIEFFIRTDRQKLVLVSLLAAFAIGFQFQAANTFRRDQETMRSFFWQLSWRAPNLKPGTLLLSYELPLKYYSDNSLSAPLNWIYAPENHSDRMPYILAYLRTRKKTMLPKLAPGQPVNVDFRAMAFTGSTTNMIVIQYSPPGCLRVLDPTYANKNSLSGLNGELAKTIPLSNLDQIQTDSASAAHLPENLFGKENNAIWCYYFEKAELARQMSDWNQVTQLGDEASAKKLKPKDPTEWNVFIEGYARAGNFSRAKTLTLAVARTGAQTLPGLCQTWERVRQAAGPASLKPVDDMETVLKCSQINPTQAQ